MSVGRHGTIAMRKNGQVRMTIRPEPETVDVEDVAMILGYVLNINDTHSRSEAIQRIWDWEHNTYHPSRITAKEIKRLCLTYLTRWQTGESMECFDGDAESHRVLLELVYDRMPRFRKVESEWDEE
tara:strand:+ start:781 stop:1158 length:378 start_codon:yes stop_codon:yes gene_type:complete